MKTAKKTYYYIGFFVCLALLFHAIGWLRPLENGVRYSLLKPLQKIAEWRVGLRQSIDLFHKRKDVENQLAACDAAARNADALNARIQFLTDENDQLRQQLNFKTQVHYPTITAEVVASGVDSAGNILVINRGTRDLLRVNLPVVSQEGVLVGKIVKAEDTVAWVRLINDSESKVAATVLNHDRSLGVVEGGYGVSLAMNFIPRNEAVGVGDKIVSSGLEQTIPRGLFIGTVAAIENEAYKPFQQAIITPGVDLSKLTFVTILQVP